ncbi:MAG: protein kinase domain-containing protein [Planctomycetota bacterium]|jgi:serine/threonine-protein kinase
MSEDAPQDPDSTPTIDPGEGSVPPVAPFPRLPLESSSDSSTPAQKNLGPYKILEEIGRGGMGVVYKAFHLQLKRTVALKVLIAGEDASEEAIARFHREAEAVAKLGHHPNIVPVYDIGHVTRESLDGTGTSAPLHYFAMHFVEGDSLEALIDQGELTPRMAASLAKRTARGLEHAHAHGVLHRDIKPANILVTGEGEPQITDFGLAKTVESDSRLTHSGATIGTPQYMPPEQADGRLRDIDELSDVYSLGATLYEMLAFVPPFDGETVMAVLHKVLQEDPVPPRKMNTIVDRDLETICMKCLEKDPERRYGSAGELASDLERYLDSKPIQARPASLLYRATKKVKRHRALVATATMFTLLLLAAVIIGSVTSIRKEREKRKASKRAENAEGKAEEAETEREVATLLREKNAKVAKVMMAGQARFFMIHRELKASYYDSRKTLEQKKVFFARYEKEIDGFFAPYLRDGGDGGPNRSARSAAFALKGWLVRLSGGEDEAISLFNRSIECDPDVGWGFLFETMAWLATYLAEKRLPGTTTSSRGVVFEATPPESEGMKNARERCEKALERFGAADRPGGAGEGLVWGTELSGGFETAVSGLSEIFGRDPLRAERSLSAILDLAEFFWMEEEIYRARSGMRYVLKEFDDGVRDASAFLERCPDNADMRRRMGLLLLGKGLTVAMGGGDPGDLYGRAILAYDESLKKNPRDAESFCNRALVYIHLGRAELSKGIDPRKSYAKAISDLNESGKLEPHALAVFSYRGIAYKNLGFAQSRRGIDPTGSLNQAIEAFSEALRRNPGNAVHHNNLGVAFNLLAHATLRSGRDPVGEFGRAIRAFETALGLDSDYLFARNNLGGVYEAFGNFRSSRGADPRELFRKAIHEFSEILERDPDDVEAFDDRGRNYKNIGMWEMVWGKDARESFLKAIADFGEALKRNPELVSAWNNRGVSYLRLGEAEEQRGENPMGSYGMSVESLKEALERKPGYFAANTNIGNVYQSISRALAARGKDPKPSYQKAIEAYERALKSSPGHAMTLNNMGNAYRRLGDVESKEGNDPRGLLRRALHKYDKALKRNPEYQRAYTDRGIAHFQMGCARAEWGEDPRPSFEAALNDYDEGLKRNPRDWHTWMDKASALEFLGRIRESERSLKEVLEILKQEDQEIAEWHASMRVLASAPAWIRTLAHGDNMWQLGAFSRAGELFEQGIREARASGSTESILGTRLPGAEASYARKIFVHAHTTLACVHSLASIGRGTRRAAPEAVTPEEADRLKAMAIASLEQALDLGYKNFAHVRKDPDLAPIRDLPEFKALVAEYEEKLAKGKSEGEKGGGGEGEK